MLVITPQVIDELNLIFHFSSSLVQVIAGSNVRGWFEPVSESSKWLKEIRTVYSNHEANIKCFFVAGYVSKFGLFKNPIHGQKLILISLFLHFIIFSIPQIWYEVLRDIMPDGELLAAPKVPLQLGDILNNGSQEHFSDRDTGESHLSIQIDKQKEKRTNDLLTRKAYAPSNCNETTNQTESRADHKSSSYRRTNVQCALIESSSV